MITNSDRIGTARDRRIQSPVRDKNVPPIYKFNRIPTTKDTRYDIGSIVLDSIGLKYYQLVSVDVGGARWNQISADVIAPRFKDKDGIVLQPIGEEARVLGEGATGVRVVADAIITTSPFFNIVDQNDNPTGYLPVALPNENIVRIEGDDEAISTFTDGDGVLRIRSDVADNPKFVNPDIKDAFGNTVVPTVDNEVFFIGQGDANVFVDGASVFTNVVIPPPIDPLLVFAQVKSGLASFLVVSVDQSEREISIDAGFGYVNGSRVDWNNTAIGLDTVLPPPSFNLEGFLIVVSGDEDPVNAVFNVFSINQLRSTVGVSIWLCSFYYSSSEIRFVSVFSEALNDFDNSTILSSVDVPYINADVQLNVNQETGLVTLERYEVISKLIRVAVSLEFTSDSHLLYMMNDDGTLTRTAVSEVVNYGIVAYVVIAREEENTTLLELMLLGFRESTLQENVNPAFAMNSFVASKDRFRENLYQSDFVAYGLVLNGQILQVQSADTFGARTLQNSFEFDDSSKSLLW
jgi:hypothetical protein